MTKIKTLLFSLISILLIVLFIIGASFAHEALDFKKAELKNIAARKDDLITQQQSIENLMKDLNQTLAYEIARQEELAKQLESLTNERNLLLEQQKQAALAPPPPPVIVTPTTTTRAS